MNWKIAIVGGIVYYVVMFAVGMVTGYFIHSPEGILAEPYRMSADFWRPELAQDPPDMAAMMKLWIPAGIFISLLIAGVYSVIRSSLTGPAWQRGLKYGVIVAIFGVIGVIGNWSVFRLPNEIWTWWAVDHIVLSLVAGTALGWVAEKLAPAKS